MTPVTMPQVGENLTSGVVLEWMKAEGESVARGEILAIVESEKAAFEVLAEADGVLLKILCDAGQEADILSVIACLGSEEETIDLDALAALVRGAKSGRDAQPVTPSPESHSKPAASTPSISRICLDSLIVFSVREKTPPPLEAAVLPTNRERVMVVLSSM